MGRDTGPVERQSRREGVDLELKGERRLRRKGALDRRGDLPPGQHGIRRRKASIYSLQLRAKQRAKRYYGIRERQFRAIISEATRRRAEGAGGGGFVPLLELRLDNVVVRSGFAVTRRQARQFVVHGHVQVNGRRVTIPSYRVDAGEVIAIAPGSDVRPVSIAATALVGTVPGWLSVDPGTLSSRVLRRPVRAEIQVPIDDQLVVEHYSRA